MNEIADLLGGIIALLLCAIPALIIAAKLLRVGRLLKKSKREKEV